MNVKSHSDEAIQDAQGRKAPDKNQLSPLCIKSIAANKHRSRFGLLHQCDTRDCFHKAPKVKN